MGALNIVLAGESAEGNGVPQDILQKLPTMTYAEAKIARTLKANNNTNANDAKVENSENQEKLTGPEENTLEIIIPGLQVDDENQMEQIDCNDYERPCEICQSEYEQADSVMVLPCNHFYHRTCIGNI